MNLLYAVCPHAGSGEIAKACATGPQPPLVCSLLHGITGDHGVRLLACCQSNNRNISVLLLLERSDKQKVRQAPRTKESTPIEGATTYKDQESGSCEVDAEHERYPQARTTARMYVSIRLKPSWNLMNLDF